MWFGSYLPGIDTQRFLQDWMDKRKTPALDADISTYFRIYSLFYALRFAFIHACNFCCRNDFQVGRRSKRSAAKWGNGWISCLSTDARFECLPSRNRRNYKENCWKSDRVTNKLSKESSFQVYFSSCKYCRKSCNKMDSLIKITEKDNPWVWDLII